MNAKRAVLVLALLALAAVAVSAVLTADAAAVDAAAAAESHVAVRAGRLVKPKTKAAKAKAAKVAAKAKANAKPAPKKAGAKATAGTNPEKKSRVRRKVRRSPIKGKTPKTTTGRTANEKGKSPVPKKLSVANTGMGSVGFASRPKPVPTKTQPKPAKNAKNAKAKNTKAKAAKNAKAKPAKKNAKKPKKSKLMKFRAVLEGEADAEAGAEVAADAEAAADAAVAVAAGPYPQAVGDAWALSDKLSIKKADVEKLAGLLPKLPAEKVFWHWDTFQACTRWTRSGLSEGEMKFFTSSSAGMYSGGGLYLAEGVENSAHYGMFPCRLVVKAGTPKYDDDVMRTAVTQKLLASKPTTEEKVALGQLIPFVHQYAVRATARPPHADWWVTHSEKVFASISGGVTALGDGTQVVPHFSNNAQGGNGKGQYAVTVQTSLDLYKLWSTYTDVDKLEPPLDVAGARDDLRGGLAWLKSFTFLFSYIDGASLFRALATSPGDPFNVFEKQRFPNFQRTYEKYIDGRLNSGAKDTSLWGWSAKGVMGNGKDTAAVWAKNALDNLLPGLYRELSEGGVMKFRDGEVRAGGDEEGRTFVATSGQVEVMKQNPYLLTLDAPPRADGSILVYYYYPDPLHRNPALKARVSPALWAEMEEDVRLAAAGNVAEFKKSERFKQHTVQLMNELILEAFTRVHGKSAAMDKGGLQIMLDLVSIHPCTDFNGRTTRFVGVVSALESSLEPPIAFMSDFDLTTPVAKYGEFLVSGTAAYLKLKMALTAELLTGVCNGRMPDHYHVSYWAKLATDALKPFAAGKEVVYDDSDWETIRARRFVPLMDKKLGTNWVSRNGKAGTPAVQTPGQEPPLVAAPAPTAPPANTPPPKLDPNDCANGNGRCSTCMRLQGRDKYGCGWHKDTKVCAGVYVVNNNSRDYVLLSGDCPRGSG